MSDVRMETIKKINEVLKKFNNTFELEAHIDKDGEEMIASGLQIKNMKNNGHEFVGILYETFNAIIKSISSEHEMIYDEDKGLVIAKKVIKTDYYIEDI